MQRFVLILDESIINNTIPDWIKNVCIKDIAYCLRINICLLMSDWIKMDEFQSKLNSVVNKQQNIENASYLFTKFASNIHCLCFKLKEYLKPNNNDNNNHFILELIWKFPTFQNINNIELREEINNGLMCLYGAFERYIECNHGHIHIINENDNIYNNNIDDDKDDENINLFHIKTWKQMFDKNCTIWNWKGSEINNNFDKIIHEIIKPFCLTSIRLKMEYNDNDDNKMDIDEKEESLQINNNNKRLSLRFNFDLIPCFLWNNAENEYYDKHKELIWKQWNKCYNWNNMKILKIINKYSFPGYLLFSDIKLIQYSQNEPIIMILNGDDNNNDKTTNILINSWFNLYKNKDKDQNKNDIAWIVQFFNDNDKDRNNINNLNDDAFMNEEEWMNLYVNQENNDNDNNGDDIDGDIMIKNNNNKKKQIIRYSSKYLVYPIYMNMKIVLIAHRIIDDDKMNGNINIGTDWIHSMINLIYKYSSKMKNNHNDKNENNTYNIWSSSYFRFDAEKCNLIKYDEFNNNKHRLNNNIWNEYNDKLLSKHREYFDNLCIINDGDNNNNKENTPFSVPPTPTNTTSSSSISSMFESKQYKNRKKKRINKKNRGLAAISAVVDKMQQTPAKSIKSTNKNQANLMSVSASKIIESAQLYQNKTLNRKNIKNISSIKTTKTTKIRNKTINNNHHYASNDIKMEDILNIFDENGELKDKSLKYDEFENNMNINNRDWRKLREMAINSNNEINGNWPIKTRYYDSESIEYEKKMERIKKQYLNGINNDNIFEIIGDLINNDNINYHPITIYNDGNNINNDEYRKKNKIALQSEIENLLKKQMDKNKYIEKYRKIRNSMLDIMWKDINKNKNNNNNQKKIDNKILKDYVKNKFEGMFIVFNMQFQ